MIYYHFASKENLYEEVVSGFVTGVVGALVPRIKESDSLDDAVAAICDTYSQLLKDMKDHRALILRELANPATPAMGRIASMIRASGLPEIIWSKLQQGVADGSVRPIDVRNATFSLIVMNLGYALIKPIADQVLGVDDPDAFIDERKATIVDLFLHGVKARPE